MGERQGFKLRPFRESAIGPNMARLSTEQHLPKIRSAFFVDVFLKFEIHTSVADSDLVGLGLQT